MKKHRHRILGAVLFVLYLVLLTYFLFFAEEMGRSPDARAEYSYNLTLFKEIRRLILYRDMLKYFRQRAGVYAVWLFFAGHLGADETLVYHRDLKLCHESHRGNDAARRQGWKFRCG